MENILDLQNKPNQPATNYKKWAFRFFIYTMITELGIAYKTASYVNFFHDESIFLELMLYFSILALACFGIGVIFTIQSYRHNEEKNYEYKVPLWGFSLIFVLTILLNVFALV